ncbi:DUF4355 domain-containing protein [Nocardiopsis aegyptia]|uniref:capsid assembly scaffolding protein Gp46 family protein n=1 Tax=Nocardiopsis aegyptia TaxID=220378 RepID=UPI00366A6038
MTKETPNPSTNAPGTGGDSGAGTGGTNAPGAGGQGNEGGQGAGGEGRTFTQAELDAILGERLARVKSQYGDYDDVKAKAEELDKLRDSERSEAERLQEQIQQANERAQKAERDLWVADAARKHHVPDDAIEFLVGSAREEIEAKAAKLAGLTKPSGDEGNNGGQGDGAPAGGNNGGHRRPDPSQGQGSSGGGTNSVAAGRQRFRERHGNKHT